MDVLSEDDCFGPTFDADSELWKLTLANKRQARVEVFEGLERTLTSPLGFPDNSLLQYD
jgi:hypothetical protein